MRRTGRRLNPGRWRASKHAKRRTSPSRQPTCDHRTTVVVHNEPEKKNSSVEALSRAPLTEGEADRETCMDSIFYAEEQASKRQEEINKLNKELRILKGEASFGEEADEEEDDPEGFWKWLENKGVENYDGAYDEFTAKETKRIKKQMPDPVSGQWKMQIAIDYIKKRTRQKVTDDALKVEIEACLGRIRGMD